MFDFKQFRIDDTGCAMKVGTDAVLLGCWVDPRNVRTIVDIGSGSGVIALMMAQRSEAENIIAVDIDEDCCRCAGLNVENSPWRDRVEVCHGDVTQTFPDVSSPFMIVSNPPFFKETLRSPDASRSLARHGDTFDVITLIEISARYMATAEDSLCFIAPTSRTEEIEFALALNGLAPERTADVSSRIGKLPIRTMWQVGNERFIKDSCRKEHIYIRDNVNRPTERYVELTSDFYIHY